MVILIWPFGEYCLDHQIKMTPLFLIVRFLLICSAWLVCLSILSDKRSLPFQLFTELEEANKAVAKILARVLDSTSEKASRGKFNSYTSVQRGEIGKYMRQKTVAAKHFTKC